MKENHELVIWSMVLFGLVLYVATFMVAWNATHDYRSNITRPLSSQSDTIRNSLHAR
ncbi:MAG: hypothetical protein O2967_12305 [Proteobacteria bacterium]|nr:hypothetical protein [Pseudomonadota bacterium]